MAILLTRLLKENTVPSSLLPVLISISSTTSENIATSNTVIIPTGKLVKNLKIVYVTAPATVLYGISQTPTTKQIMSATIPKIDTPIHSVFLSIFFKNTGTRAIESIYEIPLPI